MGVALVMDAFHGTSQRWGSGGNTYMARLYDNLDQAGFDVSLWSYPSTNKVMGGRERSFVPLNGSQPPGIWRRQIQTSLDLLRHKSGLRKMDIIHSTSGSTIVALRHIASARTKFVFDFRVPFVNTQRLMNLYKGLLFGLFNPDWVIFVEPQSLQQYRRLYHRSNCTYVPIATDTDFFRPHSRECSYSVQLLYAGVLRQDKGLEDLLRAMRLVWEQEPRVELIIAGYGPMRDQVEQLDRENPRVRYLGFVEHGQMPRLFDSVDVFVLPSYREGFSRAVLEAMSCGLPVISTAVGGLSTLQGKNVAKIIKPGHPELLAEAICEMVASKELRHRYGLNAREYVEQNHTWEEVTRQITAIYSGLRSS